MLDLNIPAIATSSKIETKLPTQQVTLRSGEVFIFEPTLLGDEMFVPTFSKVIPEGLFSRYMRAAMSQARTEAEDGTWFAEIPGFTGLWGEGEDSERALSDLSEALDDWLILKIEDGDRDLPVLENIDLNVI